MKKDLLFPIVGAIVIAAVCYGITKAVPTTPPPPSPPLAAAAESPGVHAAVPGKVIMRVNGQPVTDREFNLFISTLPEQVQGFAQLPAGRKQIANQMARLIVLQQEAEKLGARKDPDVQARLALGDANLVAQWAAEKLAGKPTDAELRAEYQKHQGELTQYQLSHILIAYQGSEVPARNGHPLPLDQAMKKAQQVEAALRGGAPFPQVAAQASDDTQSAAQGGQIGTVNPSQLPPELAQVVVKLKQGEISQPTQSRFGIHIFKVDATQTQSFDQLRPALQRQVQQTSITNAIDKLHNTAKIEMDPQFFSAGNLPIPPQGVPQSPVPSRRPAAAPRG